MHFPKNLPWHPSQRLPGQHAEKRFHRTRHQNAEDEKVQYEDDVKIEQILSASAAYFGLWRYSSPLDWLLRLVGGLAALGAGTAYPLTTIIFGNLVNDFTAFALGLESPDLFRHRINHNSLWFVYMFVGKFGLLYIADFIYCFTATRIARKIRLEYLKKVIHQPISYFDKNTPGSIAASLSTDTNIIEVGLSDKVATVLQGAGMIIGSFAIGFTKSWKMTLVVGTSIPYVIVTAMILGGIDSKFEAQRGEHNTKAAKIAEEALSSVSTITALGARDKIVKSFNVPVTTASRYTLKIGPVQASIYGNMFFSMFSTYALALFYGAKLLVDGEIKNGGTVMTVLFCMLFGTSAMGIMSPTIPFFLKAAASAQQVLKVLQRGEQLEEPLGAKITLDRDAIVGNLSLNEVTFCYPQRPTTKVVDLLSLDIPANKTTAIVGPSGCGKSTIIGLIEHWYKSSEGSISLDGVDLERIDMPSLRDQMGLVQQDPMLFNDTIFENVLNGYHGGHVEKISEKEKKHLVTDACTQANAHDFIEQLPDGYNTIVGERSNLLSGGQKQRIAIARALISNPKILLLDEATSALDSESEKIVQAALDRAAQGRTTLVVAHKLSTVEKADKIVVMNKGRVVEEGTHASLLEADGAYCKLLHAQTLTAPEGEGATTSEQDAALGLLRVTSSQLKPAAIARPAQQRLSLGSELISRRWSVLKCIFHVLRETKSTLPVFLSGTVIAAVAGACIPVEAFLFSKLISVFQLSGAQMTNRANFWASMFFVIACSNLLSYAALWFLFAIVGSTIAKTYRGRYLKDLLSQDIGFFEIVGNSSGALNALLSSDGYDLEMFFGMSLGLLLVFSVVILACGVLAIAIGWRLGLVGVFGCFPVLFMAGYFRLRFDKGAQDRCAVAFLESTRFGSEAVEAIKTVSSLALEGKVLERYEGRLKTAVLSSIKSTMGSSMIFALSDCLDFLVMGLTFWYGGQLVSKHQLGVQSFFLIYIAIIFGGQGAGFIFGYSNSITKAQAAINRMLYMKSIKPKLELHPKKEGQPATPPDTTPAITFQTVQFRYPTRPEVAVLKGLSFEVMLGENISMVGPSGSGKSTIISLLERFYEPTAGSILINGEDILNQEVETFRTTLGLVSQETHLYQGSIRDNLLLGVKEEEIEEERLIQTCKDSNIHDFIVSLPEGYNTNIGPRGLSLSGGQRQRIAIARALLRNPEILLLDEATSALDPESQSLVMEALERVGRGRTTISVTHHMEMVKRADKVLVIENGRVVESGTYEELVAMKGRFWEMAGELLGQE